MAVEKYIPTFEEVWETGYHTHTGTFKKGIFQNKRFLPWKSYILVRLT